MKRFASKPPTQLAPPQAPADETPAAFDVLSLLDKAGTILTREVRNLMAESSAGKLSPTSARDLVAYLKLLSELKSQQAEELAAMSDDQLLQIKETE